MGPSSFWRRWALTGRGRFPPTPELTEFFAWLEEEQGFKRAWIRTDYAFASVQEAVDLTGFFFGQAMAEAVAAANSPIVPECTGIWSLTTLANEGLGLSVAADPISD